MKYVCVQNTEIAQNKKDALEMANRLFERGKEYADFVRYSDLGYAFTIKRDWMKYEKFDLYEVKGGYNETPSYFDTYENALKEYLSRVKLTRNGFNIEVILSGRDMRSHAFVTLQWVIIPWKQRLNPFPGGHPPNTF